MTGKIFGLVFVAAAGFCAPFPARAEYSNAVPDYALLRKSLVQQLPPPAAGAISFDASQVKPLVRDDPDFAFLTNTPVSGMTVARIGNPQVEMIRVPDNDGGYWKVGDIAAGSYFVGIWYESSIYGLEAPQSQYGAIKVFLNGRAVQLSTHSDPIQLAPGLWYAEAQSKTAEAIKHGDEIAVMTEKNRQLRLARLSLYSREPLRGRGWMYENYGPNIFNRDSILRLNAFCGFVPAEGRGIGKIHFGQDQQTGSIEDLKRTADGRAVAYYQVANPMSLPLTVKCTAEVRSYFRELAGAEETTLVLKPHEMVTREIPFAVVPDSGRYSIEVKVKAVKPPQTGWPGLDTIDFFPGIRQGIPWPDPFVNEFRRGLALTGKRTGERTVFTLNGRDWERAFAPLAVPPPVPPPPDLKWDAQAIPFQIGAHDVAPKPHGMYVRRFFVLPREAAGQTWRLAVSRVLDEATAYINGKQVGNVKGINTPLMADITREIRPGTNEILIVVRDGLAVMDPAYVNPDNPVVSHQYLSAPGLGWAHSFGLGDVTINSAPAVAADALRVETSVRRKQVAAHFTIANRGGTTRKLSVKARVLDAGAPVMDVGSVALELAPGAHQPVSLAARWTHPVLWGPNSPKLYTLALETADAETGERLDLLRERFGFREVWTDGNRLVFNGAPMRVQGAQQGAGWAVIGSDHIQWSRGAACHDYMDESGAPTSDSLGGLFNTPSRHNVENDSYWEFETRNVLDGAARLVNHPCLLAWDLSNEWLSFVDYGGGDPVACARRFQSVGKALAAYDPTRWILFNSDGDLRGLWNITSEHYMYRYGGNFAMQGHTPYLPDSRFWRRLDRDFTPGGEIVSSASRPDIMYNPDKKVLMSTENAWKVDGLQPPGLTMVAGDDDVLSPAIDSGRGPLVWYWKQSIDGHRDLGVSAVFNYSVPGVNHRGYLSQTFIVPEHTHHYFGGATFQRRYSLHNDLFVPSKYDFRWSLLDAGGKAVEKGHDSRRMDSGDIRRGRFSFALPVVRERTRYTLRLDLLADGQLTSREDRDLEVWPAESPPLEKLTRKLALFDPAGRTAAVFAKAGISFEAVDALAAPEGDPPDRVLVIGEGALAPSLPQTLAAPLQSFVSAGGRVVVLAQEHPLPGLPVKTTLEKREWCSMVFLRTPQHPVFAGSLSRPPLCSWDLHFWAPDHVVAKGAYSRPAGGSFVTLIDGSGDHDRSGRSAMEWVEMMECYRGRGSYLLCQLPLIEKYDLEPLAGELLRRLVAYEANAAPFRTPVKTLCVAGESNSPPVARLRDLGASLRTIEPNAGPDKAALLFVDAATLPAGFDAAAWKRAEDQGATVWIHGPRPGQEPLLAALAGKPVELTAQPFAMWEGRGYRNGFTWLTPGLSHIDLYWKEYAGDEGAVDQAERPKYKLEDLNFWSAKADAAVEHVFPGALIEIPVGKGRLIVDNIRWETASRKLAPLAARVVSSMLAGLDVAVAPYLPARSLAQNVIYRPVDISVFCNRGFRDDIGDDGRGGWADQGPKADLRGFPTGDQEFGGVPFKIGLEPKCCIVLKSERRPLQDQMPQAVTIPLGYAVEGLCFLHSTSWGGQEPSHVFQIQYADGTVEEIVVTEGENVLGWTSPPSELPRERGTVSRVAWTGSTELFPVISISQMLWVNPKPGLPVKAVRFANPARNLCPILIALTAALKPGKADLEALAAAQVKAVEWQRRGSAADAAGKEAEAREAFVQAIRLDPKLDAAQRGICDIAERRKDENAILAAYRGWAAARPRTPLPYNKLGAILERRGDEQGALEAYTKSLEIEWNQPPIIEAKARLTLKVKEK